MPSFRTTVLTLGLAAATGCDGACLTEEGPIPSAFDPTLRVPSASQLRFTPSGLARTSAALSDQVLPLDVTLPLSASGTGFTVCPDARPCDLDVSVTGLQIEGAPPDALRLGLQVDVAATQIPVQLAGFDCALTASSSLAIHLPVALRTAAGNSHLGFLVGSATTTAPLVLTVGADPVLGDATDAMECPRVPVDAVAAFVVDQALGQVPPLVEGFLADTLGPGCGSCPAPATCTDYCRGSAQEIVLQPELLASRFIVPSLLGGIGYAGESGRVDTELRVGPGAAVDAAGILLPVSVGVEPATNVSRCAQPAPSPVTLPSFQVPPPLAATNLADLDQDGTPEVPYDVALSLSRAVVEQLGYGFQQVGSVCGSIGQEISDDVHTGQLQVLIPSVRFLTKSHVEPRSERPVRISVRQESPPRIELGQGLTNEGGSFIEPHVHVYLDDIHLDVSMLLEERWIRILTIDADVHLGVAAETTPGGGFQPLVGVGVGQPISRVRVSNTELLRELPEDLEATVPTLVSLLIGEAGGAQGEIDLPDIYGLEFRVLGLLSEPDAGGTLQNLVAYLDVEPPDPNAQLDLQIQTKAEISSLNVPPTEAFSVTHPGGPQRPELVLALSSQGPEAAELEHQVRIDDGGWSPFYRGSSVALSPARWLLQGRHSVDVRARVRGRPQTTDASPERIEFWIDSEPPELSWSWLDDTRVRVQAHDAISAPVVLQWTDGISRWPAAPAVSDAQGVLSVPAGAGVLRLIASDQAGHETEAVVRDAASATPEGGCLAVRPDAAALAFMLLGFLGFLGWRRRHP